MAPHALDSSSSAAATTSPIPRQSPIPDMATPQPEGVNPPNFECKHIKVIPLAPTFCAEIQQVDFTKPISSEVFTEIKQAWDQYGVLVFRDTKLTDQYHVEFSAMFGELDQAAINPNDKKARKRIFPYRELFDAGNIDINGDVLPTTEKRFLYNKGNGLWHVDSSFNPRRAAYSLLLAHQIPPQGTGGETDFADLRSAYDDLPAEKKQEMEDLVLEHTLWHSRKLGYPEYEPDEFELTSKPPSKHKLVQTHTASGRKVMYVAAHARTVLGMSDEDGLKYIWDLIDHATQKKYTVRVPWLGVGDMIAWDNTASMHRATGGPFETMHPREVRRTTVHDFSPTAWGYNQPTQTATV